MEINTKTVAEAFADLHPNKLELLKKSRTLLTSIFVLMSLFGGMVYSGFSRDVFSTSSNINTYTLPAHDIHRLELDAAKQALQTKDSNPGKETEGLKPHSVIPESLIKFLDEYKLSNYREPFFEALQTGRFQELSEAIFEKTGYMLIRLEQVSNQIQRVYGSLKYISDLKGQQNFYIFWRPPLVFKKFYYSYQGEEVLKLQNMMARVHLYPGRLDGIVGKKLMLAIVNYQKHAGLPVSGYPDENTIFLLFHEPDNKTNET
jgi:hypothetical protein